MNSIIRKMHAPLKLAEADKRLKKQTMGMSREDAYKFYLDNRSRFQYNTNETKVEFAQMNGRRCSFCTQRIPNFMTDMTVEHIETKRDAPQKICQWDNLLCACRACNTKRGTKNYDADRYLDPSKVTDIERYFAFHMDGTISCAEGLSEEEQACTKYMIEMYRLDREELNADRGVFLGQLLDDEYFHILEKRDRDSFDIHFLSVFTYYKRRKEDGE